MVSQLSPVRERRTSMSFIPPSNTLKSMSSTAAVVGGGGSGVRAAFVMPSEMRAAAKIERLRKERLRTREMEAQLRMQKIKDEINIIRQKEAGEEAPQKRESICEKRESIREKRESIRREKLLVDEYKDLKMDEELADLSDDGSIDLDLEAEAEAVLQDLQDLQEEEDHQVVDLQAQVEAVVDHQVVDHLLQLQVNLSSKYVAIADCNMHPTHVRPWLPTDNRMVYWLMVVISMFEIHRDLPSTMYGDEFGTSSHAGHYQLKNESPSINRLVVLYSQR